MEKAKFVSMYRRLAIQMFDKIYSDCSEEEIEQITAKIKELRAKGQC